MNFKPAIPSVLALALAACSAPLVTPDPPTFQHKAAHVNDWHGLADRTAEHFATSLNGNRPTVFVAPGPADTPFATAYRTLLEQELIQRNFPVAETASGAIVLRFDVQTFLHGNNDSKLPVRPDTIVTTALALGLELRHVAGLDTGAGIAAGAGPVLDILETMYDTTNAEVLLTVTESDGTRLRDIYSETVYIHPSELRFYWPQIPPSGVTEAWLPVRGGGL
ncbi:MAG: hypothetical protein ACLQUZ_04820 [Rhizomicrobium sp.]